MPTPSTSPFLMSDLPDYGEIKQRNFIKVLTIGGKKYEVLSSQALPDDGDFDIALHIKKMRAERGQAKSSHADM